MHVRTTMLLFLWAGAARAVSGCARCWQALLGAWAELSRAVFPLLTDPTQPCYCPPTTTNPQSALPAVKASVTITGNCNDAIYAGRCLIDAKAISA